MKDSWVSDTMLQEAPIAMEYPASPASQFNTSTIESPTNKATKSPNAMQHEEPSCHDMPGNQPPKQICENQSMDTAESIECVDDEEQIVPQSVASCAKSQQNTSDERMTVDDEHTEAAANVSSRIMKLGLRDLLNEMDHKHKGKESVRAPVSSNQVNVIAKTSTSYEHKQSKTESNHWYGFPRQEHVIFGPLARSSVSFTNQSPTYIPKTQVKERAGSPIITHKKFDYQKKLTLNQPNTNTPLNLCKRSPSLRDDTPSYREEESTPIDLTKKSTTKEPSNVQCQLQNPTSKIESWPGVRSQDYFFGRGGQSHNFTFGVKPDFDHYAPPRMSSFLLPRASSCSPSGSSDHSSSSAISSVDQRSDPESSSAMQDIKPSPEMLSSIHDGMVPSQIRMSDREIHHFPRIPSFDPARLNEYYMQQFATKLEGGIYTMPMTHFGGYTTSLCPPQPSSPSSKSKNPNKPDKMFICQECGAVFKHRHHVVRHMRSHSGERPFRCEECGATFARKCILTNHKRTHTGEKPFICTECGDTFSRKHHLVIHRRTHTGEKPYRCGHCGAAFARSHHLNRHRKTHIKIDTLEYPQLPVGLPLHQMHGLPTMLPMLSPNLFPKAATESHKLPNQELQEQNQGDIRETSKGEVEPSSGINIEVVSENTVGAKDPASKS